MKVAKFELRKRYKKKVIEELAEEALAAWESKEDEEDYDMEDIQDPDFVRAMQLAKESKKMASPVKNQESQGSAKDEGSIINQSQAITSISPNRGVD